MKKTFLLLTALLIASHALTAFLALQLAPIETVERIVNRTTNRTEIVYETVELGRPYYDWEVAAKAVAGSHEYSSDVPIFNCQDFTAEAVTKLRAMGYKAEPVCVIAKAVRPGTGNPRHAVLELSLYIESVTGEAIAPSDFARLYSDERYCCAREVC